MAEAKVQQKTIELWDGYSVDLNERLLDDFDFVSDLNEAINSNNLTEVIQMYMALVGGEDTYKAIRSHIEEEKGYFSQEALLDITKKIEGVFPKSGNRAQRRSWKTSA